MSAWQRSHITERAEKGLGPFSFRRLLMAAGGGGLLTLVSGRLLGFGPSLLLGLIALACLLVLSHPVEGQPLLLAGLAALRGIAAIALAGGQRGPLALLARLLRVEREEAWLDAEALFEQKAQDLPDEDSPLPPGAEFLGGYAELGGRGLARAANPFAAEARHA